MHRDDKTLQRTKEFWDKRSKDPDSLVASGRGDAPGSATVAREMREKTDLLESHFGEGKALLVVDVGCGNGILASTLSENVRIVGTDMSRGMLESARRTAPRLAPVEAEASVLPFRDSAFDAVVCDSLFDVLISDAHARQTLQELRRIVKPGGNIFILAIPLKGTKTHSLYRISRLKSIFRPKKPGWRFYSEEFFRPFRLLRKKYYWMDIAIEKPA